MKHRARMQRVLYATFLVTGSIATILGLFMIWGSTRARWLCESWHRVQSSPQPRPSP